MPTSVPVDLLTPSEQGPDTWRPLEVPESSGYTAPDGSRRGGPGRPPPGAASPRVRRNRRWWLTAVVTLAIVLGVFLGVNAGAKPPGSGHPTPPAGRGAKPAKSPGSRLDPDWTGDGRAVTFAFGGDVNFPSTSNLGERLEDDPDTALGPTVPALLAGATVKMVNFESSLTEGGCPTPQPKTYVFYAPPTAVTALEHAGITLVTEANNHGEDCGPAGLQQALDIRTQTKFPIMGIGRNVTEAFTPYEATIKGQRIAIVVATQVIDSDLQAGWTATTTQPGLASAYDISALVSEVEKVRKWADTVVVYVHWGTQLDACPNPLQEPLANALVRAGADIVVGTHAHVLLGGGYLGSAYVDYGLGNFAFYDNTPPENQSGTLLITATGRHIDTVTWRPAVIVDDLPQPLAGTAAATALNSWNAARSCTDATASPGSALATPTTEASPVTPTAANQLSVDST
ncbi:MAG TPA: CapA family protein [Acidimicrobiales bacterium]|nr:CapA family protein [Acidimicrobiales bacterium]